MTAIPIFDGHNDVLLRLHEASPDDGDSFIASPHGHLDLNRARRGGLVGGLFAIFVPNPTGSFHDDGSLPPPLDQRYALGVALAMAARLLRIEAESQGAVQVVDSAAAIDDCLRAGRLAAALHLEGADPIDVDLDALEVLARAGLRSLGLVWSRPNAFGTGVPFRFPADPDIGPGLTEAGRALLRACNRLHIMVDLSHLNEAGFWDVARLSDAPLVASHSNAHALCPSPRNLTDRQLDAIRESDGIVGVNLHVGFLRPDGRRELDTPLDVVADHFVYLVERLGIDRVGLGSDFDGAMMPAALGDAAGLPRLVEALRARGFDDPSLRKLGGENWLRVLRRTWGR